MAKQAGTITKRGDGVWRVQAYTGVCVGGEYQRVTRTVHGTKREAQAVLRDLMTDIESGLDVSGGNRPFDRFAREWLESRREAIAPRTLAGYSRCVEVLCSVLGSTQLCKIDVRAVERTMAAIEERLTRNGKKPTGATLKTYYSVFSLIMAKAESYDWIKRNPVTRVKAPHVEEGARRSLTRAQYADMLRQIETAYREQERQYLAKEQHIKETGHANKPRRGVHGVHVMAFLAAARIMHATGARPSEVFALQWECVNLGTCELAIKQATATSEGGIKETKTAAGCRVVSLDAATADFLASWKAMQRNAALTLGVELGQSAFVVCTDRFTQASQSNFNAWWRKWADASGFKGWQAYELRHTQVTLLLESGLDVKNTQERVGHSSAKTTLDIYAKATKQGQRKAADILAGIAKM